MQAVYDNQCFSLRAAGHQLSGLGLMHSPFFMNMLKLLQKSSRPYALLDVFMAFFTEPSVLNLIQPFMLSELSPFNKEHRQKIRLINRILYFIASVPYPHKAFNDCIDSQFIVFLEDRGDLSMSISAFIYAAGYDSALMALDSEAMISHQFIQDPSVTEWYFLVRGMISSHSHPIELAAAMIFLRHHADKNQQHIKPEVIYAHASPLKAVVAFIILNFFANFKQENAKLKYLDLLFERLKEMQSPRHSSDSLLDFDAEKSQTILMNYAASKDRKDVENALWMDCIFNEPFLRPWTFEFALILAKLYELNAWIKINSFDAYISIMKNIHLWIEHPEFLFLFLRLPNEFSSVDLFDQLRTHPDSMQDSSCENIDWMIYISHTMRSMGQVDGKQKTHGFFEHLQDRHDRPHHSLIFLKILQMQLQDIPSLSHINKDIYLQLFNFSIFQSEEIAEVTLRKSGLNT